MKNTLRRTYSPPSTSPLALRRLTILCVVAYSSFSTITTDESIKFTASFRSSNLYPPTTTIFDTPKDLAQLMAYQIKDFPPTSTRGLGRSFVRCFNRDPIPAAKITAVNLFITSSDRLFYNFNGARNAVFTFYLPYLTHMFQ